MKCKHRRCEEEIPEKRRTNQKYCSRKCKEAEHIYRKRDNFYQEPLNTKDRECSICHETKDYTHFYQNVNKSAWCKECYSQKNKLFRDKQKIRDTEFYVLTPLQDTISPN